MNKLERVNENLDLLPGTFVRLRSKSWVVEQAGRIGSVPFLDLISVEDDAQGEALRVASSSEVDLQVIDPDDWSALFQTKFEGPERLCERTLGSTSTHAAKYQPSASSPQEPGRMKDHSRCSRSLGD